jgi:hypothetical protein
MDALHAACFDSSITSDKKRSGKSPVRAACAGFCKCSDRRGFAGEVQCVSIRHRFR